MGRTSNKRRVPGEADADRRAGITAEEARRRRGKTDWAYFDATTDEEIARQIAEDPDTAPDLSGDEWAARAVVVEPVRKTLFSLRLDPDVLAWYRGLGRGYQARMNAVLRAYMEHRAREGKKGSVP